MEGLDARWSQTLERHRLASGATPCRSTLRLGALVTTTSVVEAAGPAQSPDPRGRAPRSPRFLARFGVLGTHFGARTPSWCSGETLSDARPSGRCSRASARRRSAALFGGSRPARAGMRTSVPSAGTRPCGFRRATRSRVVNTGPRVGAPRGDVGVCESGPELHPDRVVPPRASCSRALLHRSALRCVASSEATGDLVSPSASAGLGLRRPRTSVRDRRRERAETPRRQRPQ